MPNILLVTIVIGFTVETYIHRMEKHFLIGIGNIFIPNFINETTYK